MVQGNEGDCPRARVTYTPLSLPMTAFKNVGHASPPTKLVFYEDLVATVGVLIAMLAIVLAKITGLYIFDGFGAVLIGILLVIVAFKVGYDNMQGLIGVSSPIETEEKIADAILGTDKVVDIKTLMVTQDGRFVKVEGQIELIKGLTLATADDIKVMVKANIKESAAERSPHYIGYI